LAPAPRGLRLALKKSGGACNHFSLVNVSASEPGRGFADRPPQTGDPLANQAGFLTSTLPTKEKYTAMNTLKPILTVALAGVIALTTTSLYAKERTNGRGAPGTPVIYVTSQDLYYDTLLLGDLPYNGTENFQLLEPGIGPTGVQTEFGPGDTGYYGGRWWVDANPNGYMDEDDVYFLCPLLGPGRTEL